MAHRIRKACSVDVDWRGAWTWSNHRPTPALILCYLVPALQVHQIMKQIVTMAVAQPECRDLARFFNLKAEMINNAAVALGACTVMGLFRRCVAGLFLWSTEAPVAASLPGRHGMAWLL